MLVNSRKYSTTIFSYCGLWYSREQHIDYCQHISKVKQQTYSVSSGKLSAPCHATHWLSYTPIIGNFNLHKWIHSVSLLHEKLENYCPFWSEHWRTVSNIIWNSVWWMMYILSTEIIMIIKILLFRLLWSISREILGSCDHPFSEETGLFYNGLFLLRFIVRCLFLTINTNVISILTFLFFISNRNVQNYENDYQFFNLLLVSISNFTNGDHHTKAVTANSHRPIENWMLLTYMWQICLCVKWFTVIFDHWWFLTVKYTSNTVNVRWIYSFLIQTIIKSIKHPACFKQ